MIFAKDGDINIDGTQESVTSDWCYLTSAIFEKLSSTKEEKFEMMRKTIEFLIEKDEELSSMEQIKEN